MNILAKLAEIFFEDNQIKSMNIQYEAFWIMLIHSKIPIVFNHDTSVMGLYFNYANLEDSPLYVVSYLDLSLNSNDQYLSV